MFANRTSAGRELSGRLQHLRHEKPVVLALPRGGVPVGFEIAEQLDAPLDIILVRKIGVPWQPELALGAVVDGADPQVIFNDKLAAELGIERDYIAGETARQLQEIERRRKIYLGDRPSSPLAGATVIVVDDGIATGSTVRAALRAVRKSGAAKIVLAVPVAPEDTLDELRGEVDEIVFLGSPSPFIAVGAHYAEFAQLTDADVVALLEKRHRATSCPADRPDG
ncbi:MAG TPA: phosphoribosyltransferase [Steroidobacteraceae bacterium]|jgi:putative phosphoribosyl transferase|nr:phosphoribosyltransferase [Steroidobacteraceae bacterium]